MLNQKRHQLRLYKHRSKCHYVVKVYKYTCIQKIVIYALADAHRHRHRGKRGHADTASSQPHTDTIYST